MSQKFDPMTGEPIIETEQIAEDIKEEKLHIYLFLSLFYFL